MYFIAFFFFEEYPTYQKHLYCKSVYCGGGSSPHRLRLLCFFFLHQEATRGNGLWLLRLCKRGAHTTWNTLAAKPSLKMSVGNTWLQDSALKDLCILKMIFCCGFGFLHESWSQGKLFRLLLQIEIMFALFIKSCYIVQTGWDPGSSRLWLPGLVLQVCTIAPGSSSCWYLPNWASSLRAELNSMWYVVVH